jgi:hypothetical protein
MATENPIIYTQEEGEMNEEEAIKYKQDYDRKKIEKLIVEKKDNVILEPNMEDIERIQAEHQELFEKTRKEIEEQRIANAIAEITTPVEPDGFLTGQRRKVAEIDKRMAFVKPPHDFEMLDALLKKEPMHIKEHDKANIEHEREFDNFWNLDKIKQKNGFKGLKEEWDEGIARLDAGVPKNKEDWDAIWAVKDVVKGEFGKLKWVVDLWEKYFGKKDEEGNVIKGDFGEIMEVGEKGFKIADRAEKLARKRENGEKLSKEDVKDIIPLFQDFAKAWDKQAGFKEGEKNPNRDKRADQINAKNAQAVGEFLIKEKHTNKDDRAMVKAFWDFFDNNKKENSKNVNKVISKLIPKK